MAQLPGAAAAGGNVAAGEEEIAAWEDALDLDDSDIFDPPPLPRSLHATATQPQPQQDKPPHTSHHHPSHRSPGPAAAAAVQDTVLPRCATGPPHSSGRGDARATDADFLGAPWLCALQFLGKDRAWEQPGIRAIKADEKLLRAPLVAGVVTSCKPNGLGDLFLVIKDPTYDSIVASVHKKVLLEENNGHDISVGCAVVLSKVAVFHPSRKSCYLNVTKGKMIKVFSKHCAVPANEVICSSTTERSQSGHYTRNIMMKVFGHEDIMSSNNEMTVNQVSDKHSATHDSNQEAKLPVPDPHNIGCFSTPKENSDTSSESILKRKRSVSEWTEDQLSQLFADY